MKRIDLIRDIEKNGCVFVRSGANHDIYINYLARHIKKILA